MSETKIRGYVVRARDEEGAVLWAGEHVEGEQCALFVTEDRDVATEYENAREAASAMHRMVDGFHISGECILVVAKDGTETPLPTYEEALAVCAVLADARAEVLDALAYQEAGGQRVAKPPALSGCSRGALLELRRMLGGV